VSHDKRIEVRLNMDVGGFLVGAFGLGVLVSFEE